MEPLPPSQQLTEAARSPDVSYWPVTCDDLKLFAEEAELSGEHQQAELYYQECVVRERSSATHWFEYGAFFMRRSDRLMAQCCFNKALLQEPTHTASLLMCGVLADMSGQYEEAESFLERATRVEPSSVVAWTLYGVFFNSWEKYRQADAAFQEARKLLERSTQSSIYIQTLQFLMKNGALQMAQRTLALEPLSSSRGSRSSFTLARAQLQYLRGDHGGAMSSLKEALTLDLQDPEVWALLGHVHHGRGDTAQARSCFEHALLSGPDSSDSHAVSLRLASIYLREGQNKKAKAVLLRACQISPSCLSWLALGTACYRLEQLMEAEEHLIRANALENRNPETWAYLCLVNLKLGRKQEADIFYKHAVKNNLQNEALLREIKEMQHHTESRAFCG